MPVLPLFCSLQVEHQRYGSVTFQAIPAAQRAVQSLGSRVVPALSGEPVTRSLLGCPWAMHLLSLPQSLQVCICC